jgi:hypothetical protein
MPNKSAKMHVAAYTTVHNKLVRAGLRPKLHMLDNECSQLLRDHITSDGTALQTTPVAVHQRNAAERAIQTFKNHFIAGLCTTDPNFPLQLWDRLLEQSDITLNLLRASRVNPKLSAYAQVFGQFDFIATPMAPPGIHVLVHEKPQERQSWAPKGKDGWYLGPAMDSYRCFWTYIWDTQRERKADTLSWFLTHIQMPIAGTTDLVIAGINDIARALENNLPNALPLTTSEKESLQHPADMFTTRTTHTNTESEQPSAPNLRVEPDPDTPTYIQQTKHRSRRTKKHKTAQNKLNNATRKQKHELLGDARHRLTCKSTQPRNAPTKQ